MAPNKKAKATPTKSTSTATVVSPYAVFRTNESVASHGCAHLAELKHDLSVTGILEFAQLAKDLIQNYRDAIRQSLGYFNRSHFQIPKKGAGSSSKKDEEDEAANGKKRKKPSGLDDDIKIIEQIPMPCCVSCEDILGRLHVCLHCMQMFCMKDRHLHTHLETLGHIFAMELGHHAIYCHQCKDYVYDIDFDRVIHSERFRMDSLISRFKDPGIKRVRTSEWMPSIDEAKGIKKWSSPAKKCSGIRGLRNMGATCYLNVVLQTFIHNPLMRIHFMSDKHNPQLCKVKAAKQICLACELDNLYTNFFNGQNTPFGPTSFIYSLWKSNSSLASPAQHDAHECFMSLLNLIHTSCCGSLDSGSNTSCKCIIHTVFAGVLQSEVTCQKCHNITTTHDPIFDLSLTIRHSKSSKSSKSSSKKKSGQTIADATPESKSDAKSKGKDDHCTLLECLERNFAAEKLTAYQCGNPDCAKTESVLNTPPTPGAPPKEIESIKHVTVKTLPPVLSIQLKRFEHSGQGSKVETFVKIPVELDMTPYTTRSVKSRTKKSKKDSTSSKKHSTKGLISFDPLTDSVPDYRYSLFAVINHQGKLETGHYTAYVKSRGEWFSFDDHNVQMATLKDVLESKVYMCFYVRENHLLAPSAIIDGQDTTPDGLLSHLSKLSHESSSLMMEDEVLASADVSPISRELFEQGH